jgi:glycosyltransferase involved in cell wall biosynthesis
MSPAVSVVIPTYNRRQFIGEAVASVLQQGFDDIEIIVVDDGSTDDTAEVLASFGAAIRSIYQENKGVSAARNRGVMESRGTFLAFLDSDDLWTAGKLDAQIGHMSDGRLSFAGVEWFVDGLQQRVSPASLGVRWPQIDRVGRVIDPVLDVAEGRYLHLGTLLCRRADFLVVGLFDETLSMGEDEDWFSRASLQMRFHYTPEPLLQRRFHPAQTGTESEASLRSLIRVFGQMKERTELVHPRAHAAAKQRLAAKWSHLANVLNQSGRRSEASEAARTAFLLNPLNIGRLAKAVSYR